MWNFMHDEDEELSSKTVGKGRLLRHEKKSIECTETHACFTLDDLKLDEFFAYMENYRPCCRPCDPRHVSCSQWKNTPGMVDKSAAGSDKKVCRDDPSPWEL